MSGRWLLAVIAAVLAALAMPAVRSGATLNSTSANPGNTVTADHPLNYLRTWSQSTDPFGTTGYAIRRNSSPATPAATGAATTLYVDLGGNRNVNNLAHNRVLTVDAVSPLPAGSSPITVAVTLQPDPASGLQPIVSSSLTTLAGVPAPNLLLAGDRRQLNLVVKTTGMPQNTLYVPTVTITVTFAGYSGGFLSYVVPVEIWNGNGVGP